MPSLVFLGQRWHVGEDDLFLPMALAAMARVAIATTILTLGLLARGLSSCDGRGLVLAYLIASIIACVLAAISEIGIAIVALAGTITYTQPRARARRFLHVKTAVFSLQMALAVVGIFIAATLRNVCDFDYVPHLLLSAVLVAAVTQVLDCAGAGCCFVTFSAGRAYDDLMEDVGVDAAGSSSGARWQRQRRSHRRRRRRVADLEAELENKCRAGCRALGACTCYVFGGGGPEADFQHVARVLARIFYTEEDLDVVPSDIAAGMVLLHHAQKSRELALRDDFEATLREEGFGGRIGNAGGGYGGGHSAAAGGGSSCTDGNTDRAPVPVAVAAISKSIPLAERRRLHAKYFKASRGKVLDMDDAADRAALEEATHFARYACAVYGWMLHVFAHPLTGLSGIVSSACSRRDRRIQRNRGRRDAGASGVSGGGSGPGGSGGGGSSGLRSPPSSATNGVDPGGGGGISDSADERRALTRGDNCLAWHEAALLRAANLEDSELAFAHFGNDVRRTPYCIFVDHRWQCVVIAVRGTLSFEDCIVDAMAEPWSMEELGSRWGFHGKDIRAHKGILDRAEWVRQDLEEHGVLAGLLGPGASSGSGGRPSSGGGGSNGSSDAARGPAASPSANEASRSSGVDASTPLRGWASSCRGYSLRVTGHSLGAGVAVLLTAMLRPRYRFTRCVAVSPPGGLVSRESVAAQNMGEWCLAVVLNNDIVPRMSLQSLEKLRDDVLELVGRSKVSKLAVMRSALVPGRSAHRLDQYVAGPDSPPPHATPYLEQLGRYKQRLASQREGSELAHLWPPCERILHLVKTDAKRGGCCGRRTRRIYTPVWSPADHLQEIIIGRTTLTDHFPDNTLAALEEVRQDVLGESP